MVFSKNLDLSQTNDMRAALESMQRYIDYMQESIEQNNTLLLRKIEKLEKRVKTLESRGIGNGV